MSGPQVALAAQARFPVQSRLRAGRPCGVLDPFNEVTMSKHRRTTHYRKIAIAAVALTAVGVPSVAMACGDRQYDWRDESQHRWNRDASHDHWWDETTSSPKPTPTASESRSTASSAPTASTKAPSTKAPSTKKAAKKKATKKKAAKKAATQTPSAKPSPSTAPTASAATTSVTKAVVDLVNSERGKAGCAPVTVDAVLTKAAQKHSEDMADHRTMSHSGSDGSSAGERLTRAGYAWSTYGENVAYGYTTAKSVMAGWMSSPGHKRNILNCAFKEIGIGLAQPGNYWTQDFATAR
nr:CAP domain-containing protein [Streptomyces phyllanthi]